MNASDEGRPSAADPQIDARIQSILEHPGHSHWLKAALRQALFRDCADAAREAAILADVLQIRATCLLDEGRP